MSEPNEPEISLDESYSSAWSEHDECVGTDNDSPPSAADFLKSHPHASPAERLDVLLADQLLRWRRGCPKLVGDYIAEHPDSTCYPEAILKLIQGEFLALLESDQTPDPANYMRMFPELTEEIRSQCEVDRWMTKPFESTPSLPATADHPASESQGEAPLAVTTGGVGESPWPAYEPSTEYDAPLREADFKRTRLLGSGGMGEVYEALQKSLRKKVALKLIKRDALDSPSRVRRFFAEARALARLRHPHIVGVHGIGRMTDGRYFLVMDLIAEGTTLSPLSKSGAVSCARAAGLVATVAEAIAHAHSRGVIHRDLKPSNVLIDADGNPHVTDFGLAKVFDSTDPDQPQTTADAVLGTPHYMTPEQADPSRGPITPRTDVYALGGLLYTLLTGKPPIQGDSLTALLAQVVSPAPVRGPRELRAEIPPALDRICRTCLEKDAANRFASASSVAVALRAWLSSPHTEPHHAEIESERSKGAELNTGSRALPDPHLVGGTVSHPDPLPDVSRDILHRADWAPDRSLKENRHASSPDHWATKLTIAARKYRRVALTGVSVVTFILVGLLVAGGILNRSTRVATDMLNGGKAPKSSLAAEQSQSIGSGVPADFAAADQARSLAPVPTLGSDGAAIAFRASKEIIDQFGAGNGAIAIVLDCSGSMLDPKRLPKFSQAKTALKQLLVDVPAGTMVSLWTFGQLPENIPVNANGEAFAHPGRENEIKELLDKPERTIQQIRSPKKWAKGQVDELMRKLDRIAPYFSTPLVQAMLEVANKDLKSASGMKTLLVLTDGNDTQIEKDATINPTKLTIADFISEHFRAMRIRINMVFFTPAGNAREIERAQASFTTALNGLDPPGSFGTADNLIELKQTLKRGIEQKLTCQILKADGTPGADAPLGVSAPGELEQWSQRLVPGIYTLRFQADKTYAQEIDLKKGDRIIVNLDVGSDGAIRFVRDPANDGKQVPRLVLMSDPIQYNPVPFGRLPLRAIPGRQNYFVVVRNPSEIAREVIVEVVVGPRVIADSGAKPALEAPPQSDTRVASFGTPTRKETDVLPEVPGKLKLRLRNASTDEVFDQQPLEPAIAAPLDYLEVKIQRRFIPSRLDEPNSLEMTLGSTPKMTGPPCRIKLTIPSDKKLFPAYLEPPGGRLAGELIPGGEELTLYAKGIKLDPAAKNEEGLFYLTVDGLERVLWYRTRFVAQGETQFATRDLTPRVRFVANCFAEQDQPAKLIVTFSVDNAPPDARLAFRVGQFRGGQFVDDLTFVAGAKHQHIGFDPVGPGGALQFEASERDWIKEFTTTQTRGLKRLQASLIDSRTHDVFDTSETELVLDDVPPQDALVEIPAQVDKGTARLSVRASVTPPISGIQDVAFILGSKDGFTKPGVEGKLVPGKPTDGDRRVWEGTLPLPKDAAGKLVVTARFTSGVGLITLASAEVSVVEPVTAPEEAAAKPEPK